jgi:hypothetical protein
MDIMKKSDGKRNGNKEKEERVFVSFWGFLGQKSESLG